MNKTARAIIINDGKVLLFFRRRIKDGKKIVYYSLPGGHLEGDEKFEDAVVREVKEEMNIDVKVLDYVGVNEDKNCEERVFYCEIVGGDIKFGGEELERCSEDNYYEIRWVLIDDIDKMMLWNIDFVRKVVMLNDK